MLVMSLETSTSWKVKVDWLATFANWLILKFFLV